MTLALVTGSKGFIGSNITQKLLELNYDVFMIDKKPKNKGSVNLDVATEDFTKYFDKHPYSFEYIFHFGSPCSVIQFNKNPSYCMMNTLYGFRNILKLTKKCNAKLIYPSSGNVYGSGIKSHVESDKPHPVNLYGLSKSWCEDIATFYSVNTTGLRIFCGYGAGEEMKGYLASVLYQFLSAMMKGESPVIWGNGSQMRDFVHIDDIVDCALASMKVKAIPFVNVASGFSCSYIHLIALINKILGQDISPKYVAKPKKYVEKTFANIKLMKNVLGVKPRALEDGLNQFSSYLDLTRDRVRV